MLVWKHSMRLFPFSWRGNMHFRKAYLLLFQVRFSLLPLCKYLVRNKFSIIWVNFYGFGVQFGKKILIKIRNILSKKCFLFYSNPFRLRLFQSQKLYNNLCKLYAIFLAWFKIHGFLEAKYIFSEKLILSSFKWDIALITSVNTVDKKNKRKKVTIICHFFQWTRKNTQLNKRGRNITRHQNPFQREKKEKNSRDTKELSYGGLQG